MYDIPEVAFDSDGEIQSVDDADELLVQVLK
jgi:hypothetical protein